MPNHLASSSLLAAALFATPQLALAQSAPFCLKSALGAVSCTYHTMILCEQAKQPNSRDQCIPRFQADETTGSSGAPLGGPRQPVTTRPAINPAPTR
jgi:hypothetical protein